ncbi:UvrD-helicase domain-containing protein [Kitasatospora sp. NPDC001175]|uniref:UvrD-helicase domain-containing protein n=1 Tax=Kitasatospora sp. NPDC001175 TaxID=3157103 RepID=UPI003CFDDF6D
MRALHGILKALDSRRNFKLEAGAGAGKTHSLIDTLQHILKNRLRYLPRDGQRVACVTYTNVARNEIIRRTDASPHVFAGTIHGFLWEIIATFRKSVLQEIPTLRGWDRVLDGRTSLQGCSVNYDLGFRGIDGNKVHLAHEDVPALAARLFASQKFRSLTADRFPIIFVDEYQDTPSGLAEAMLGNLSATPTESTYGFFGDHWQQIYDRTCGSIDHLPVVPIEKRANWRSGAAVVSLLNGMRPELPQAPVSGAEYGSVTVYHTNNWIGPRGTHSSKGQLPDEALKKTLRWVINDAQKQHWDEASVPPKILMLTHSSIARELGFGSIDRTFKYNDDYVRKSDEVVAFLLDVLEPCCDYFGSKQYGLMFDLLKRSRPRMMRRADKIGWTDLFDRINVARNAGTVGDVLDIVLEQTYFAPPRTVVGRQRKWELAQGELEHGQELSEPRRLVEYGKFRNVNYREVVALREYVQESTPFSTQHGVKGEEYPSVVAVFGGWSRYNFPMMLADFPSSATFTDDDRKRFERSRNLFYVACSRARKNLVLLFTTELSDGAIQTLEHWIGHSRITGVCYSPEGDPVSP